MTKDELEVALKAANERADATATALNAAQARGDELEVSLNATVSHKMQLEGEVESLTEQLNAATEIIRKLGAVAPTIAEVAKAGAEFPKMLYFQGDHKKYIIVKSASEEEQAGEDWWDALAP